jgi:hypothetical protein
VWLALTHPIVTLAIVSILLAIIAWLLPKIVRLIRRNLAKIRSILTGHRIIERPAE